MISDPVNVHSVDCSTTKKATKAIIETFDIAVFILGIMRTDDKHIPYEFQIKN